MDAEEHFLDALDEDSDGLVSGAPLDRGKLDRQQQKNKAVIGRFLGKGRRVRAAGVLQGYYNELLSWALHRYIADEGWTVYKILGYAAPEPKFADVHTDHDKAENLLVDGQLLLTKGEDRFIVTIDTGSGWRASVHMESLAEAEKQCQAFIAGITAMARDKNFYRGKKLEFGGRIRFLDVPVRVWESVVLDTAIKADIKANTTAFLGKRELWGEYGIPSKRGIILAGEPGTGKTVICKALMAEAEGITCIVTSAYAAAANDYITELYDLAQDLSPSIVFIEDIDLIGEDREESGYSRGPALISLLSVLDGIEEKKQIVTVATTNCLDKLDKALGERPSRFDRVIKLSRPSLQERLELINLICQKIPVNEPERDYLSHRTDGFTPAQVQEILYSLVIDRPDQASGSTAPGFRRDDIDRAIARVNGKSGRRAGFNASNPRNGHKVN